MGNPNANMEERKVLRGFCANKTIGKVIMAVGFMSSPKEMSKLPRIAGRFKMSPSPRTASKLAVISGINFPKKSVLKDILGKASMASEKSVVMILRLYKCCHTFIAARTRAMFTKSKDK